MIFDIQEIITYSECPMKFYFKYILKDNRQTIEDVYEHDILQIVYSLFNMMQDKEISIIPLKMVWGRKWINKKSKDNFIYDVPKSWRNSYESFKKKGIEAIVFLFEEYSNAGYAPLVIDQEYSLKLSDSVSIKGKFPVIAERNGQIEILLFRNFKMIDRFYLKNDYEASISSIAFRKMFNRTEDLVSLNCYERKKVIREIKNPNQLKTVIKDILSVTNSIQQKNFYRSINQRCFYCPFKKECSELYDIDQNLVQSYIVEIS